MSNSFIASLPTHIQKLDNGLHVIVREDHYNPVASVQGWVCTGSIHESKWLGSGISHLLEHLLFKGTTTRKGQRIDHEIQEAGGYINAYTSFDRTVYWINLPAENVNVAIDVICDVLQNAVLPEEEFVKETEVIRREMDMGEDDPHTKSSRLLFETAYTVSHYRYPIIGNKALFDQLTRGDVVEYYRARYVPNNIFLVIAGAVNPERVFEKVRETIGKAIPRPLPTEYLPTEPIQLSPRECVVSGPVELTYLHVAWHIPDFRHTDMPALDVLALLLGMGRSSRLFVELHQKKALVLAIDAWTFNPGAEGLFGISAVTRAENFKRTLEEIHAQIEGLKSRPVTYEELQKAIKQCIAARLASRKTVEGQAAELGSSWILAKDLTFLDTYLEKIKAVTPEQIYEVAQRYLRLTNQTTCALTPEVSRVVSVGTTPRGEASRPQLFKPANELRVIIKEDRRLPFVNLVAVFGGGTLFETPANAGITRLLSKMLLRGTKSRSAEQIVATIEGVGGHINTFSGNHSLGITMEVFGDDFELALEILHDVIFNSVFPAEALEQEKALQLDQIAAERDDLLTHGLNVAKERLFGSKAYGLNILGSEESLKKITVESLKEFWMRLCVPRNCVFAVYGNCDFDRVTRGIERCFGAWCATSEMSIHELISQLQVDFNTGSKVVEPHDKNQAVVIVILPGTTVFSVDKYPIELIQESCSDIGSRLFIRIRESLGLAYYTGAINFPGLVPGYLAFYAGTAPNHAETIVKEILSDLAELRQTGLQQEELDRVKAKVLGQRKLSRQDLGNQARAAALDELLGLGYLNQEAEDKHFEAITRQDVVSVTQRYIDPEKAVIVVLKPEPS